MTVKERIASLRSLMKANSINAYLVPSEDNHQSEYVGSYFKCREFMSGFTGSQGDLVVTADKAGLWTDARYFIQAEHQLKDSGIKLYKMREPGYPTLEEFLLSEIPQNGTLGFDGRVVAMRDGEAFQTILSKRGIAIDYSNDLVAKIWTDRPDLPKDPAFILPEKYTGESTASKLKRIRKVMNDVGANAHILTTLDDICWIINLRGNDIDYSPMLLCYAIIKPDSMDLYIDKAKLSIEILDLLDKDSINVLPYNEIYEDVKNFNKNDCILIDPKKVNYAIYNNIPKETKKIEKTNPSNLFKAMKNDVEVKNFINAHIKDGVAVTKFMHWMKTHVGKEKITEVSSAEKLEEFRKEGEGYLWQSFEPICSYKEHAAIVHYSATPETDVEVLPSHLFLSDTGGNYMEGTTDVTRTFVLGEISEEEIFHFTTVLRSMLGLADAKFLYGCTGYNLDILARKPMWDINLDFKHGTGHGVGYCLSVHEGPGGFRWQQLPYKDEAHILEKGMIISDEPGIYIENSHGIRLENLVVVKEGLKNEFGQFMYLEPITYVPIDLDGVDVNALTNDERILLNVYHKKVYETISPYFSDSDKEWLKEYTREI
ncbi:MAG: aminopeptidase P family protein [Suipraeoptans sp.]